MTDSGRKKAYLGALLALLFVLFSVFPTLGGRVYSSPDETAYAAVVQQIADHAAAFVPDALVRHFPWLHPRSWVSQGDKIVPVGFLGWPAVLSLFYKVFGDWILPWIGSLLILSSAWAFFRILEKRFGFSAAWWGTLVAFTVPSLILYANRGLFPNGPVLALGIWGFYLIEYLGERGPQKRGWYFLTAFVCFLALAARPVEGLWLVPWWAWAGYRLRPTRRQWIEVALAALLLLLPLGLLARGAYGSFFGVGYALQDDYRLAEPLMIGAPPAIGAPKPSSVWWLPYGIHPRNLLWNLFAYFGELMWPWLGLAIAAVYLYGKRQKSFRRIHLGLMLAFWTLAILLFFYGSGLYVDRFGGQIVSIGNSFLRYLLPVAPLLGWSFAYLWKTVSGIPRWRTFGIICGIFLAVVGVYRAMIADDEGLLVTRGQLTEYLSIRAAAAQWFKPGDVILSDRSDKIFFPTYRAVSPLPTPQQAGLLARSEHLSLGLFARPLAQQDKDAWRNAGLDAQELATFDRERLYRLVPISR